MSQDIYAFSDRQTLQRVIDLVRTPTDLSTGDPNGIQQDKIWYKITEKISDTEVKAIQVVRDKNGDSEDFPNGLTWDTDQPQEEIRNVENLICFDGFKFGEVDSIGEAVSFALDSESVWVGFPPSAGGSAFVYLEITGSNSISEYTAQIYDNPVDLNPVGGTVLVYANQHDAGIIPNSPPGKGPFATQIGGLYYLTNYSMFFGD